MQAHDGVAERVVGRDGGDLLFEVHAGGAAHLGAGLGARGERDRHEAAGVEDEIGLLQQLASAHADQIGIARPGADDGDLRAAAQPAVERGGECVVMPVADGGFLFGQEQLAPFGCGECGGLGDAGHADLLVDHGGRRDNRLRGERGLVEGEKLRAE